MISIDRVYKAVLAILNSDLRGNVKVDEVRLNINNAVHEIRENYFIEINKLINRENRGLVAGGLENLPDRYREKILHFATEAELDFDNGLFILPSDYWHIDSIYYNDREIEPCKDTREFKLISNVQRASLSTSYPIYIKVGDKIRVAPDTIEDNVTLHYLRKHNIAKWTFVVIDGNEVFNPSAPDFQDIDLHPSEEINVIQKTLKYFGVNLKEEQIVTFVRGEEAIRNNEENTM